MNTAGHVLAEELNGTLRAVHLHGASIGETKCLVSLWETLRSRSAFALTRFVLTYTSLSAQDWLRARMAGSELTAFRLNLDRLSRELAGIAPARIGCIIAEKDRRSGILAIHDQSCFVVNIEAKPPQSRRSSWFDRYVAKSLRRIVYYAVENEAYAEEIRARSPKATVRVVGTLKAPASSLKAEPTMPLVAFVSLLPHEARAARDVLAIVRSSLTAVDAVLIPRYAGAGTLPWRRGSHNERVFTRVLPRSTVVRSLGDLGHPLGQQASEGRTVLLQATGCVPEVMKHTTVAVVGGSLTRGLVDTSRGHNFMEPMAVGVPTIIGPHYRNWRHSVSECSAEGSLLCASSPTEVASYVTRLLCDRTYYERCRATVQSSALLAYHQGSAARIADFIGELSQRCD